MKFVIKMALSCIKLTIKEKIKKTPRIFKKIIRDRYYFVILHCACMAFVLVSGKTGSHVAQASLKLIINLRMTSNS